MLKEKLQEMMKLNAVTGVEVHTGKDGQRLLHACSISIVKQQLSFESRQHGLKSVLHFAKVFKPQNIAICLSGKGVITKKIERVQGIDQQVVNQVLPNANPEHFYFQHYTEGEHSFISAIRRTDADELLARFQESGFRVLSLSLDTFVQQNAMELKAGQLEPGLELAYAAAFQLLLNAGPIAIEHEQITRAREQAFAKAKLKGIAMVAGLVLLVLLLFNFMLFSYYSSQVKSLSAASNISSAEIGKLRGQEKDIAKKTGLIKAAGWTGGLNYAYITDQLLAAMPGKMGLQEFSINPPDEQQSRSRHESVYLCKAVKITGSCPDASMLNNWIFAIKAKDWVEGCKIINYAINPDDGSGLFTISVQLKDHEE